MPGFRLARGKVHIGEGIQFRHDDVDVVGSDAGREHGDPLSVVFSGGRNEFPGLPGEFDVGKIFRDHCHSARVSHQDDDVCKFIRSEMDVEC